MARVQEELARAIDRLKNNSGVVLNLSLIHI